MTRATIMRSSPEDSPLHDSNLLMVNSTAKFQREHRERGTEWERGRKIRNFYNFHHHIIRLSVRLSVFCNAAHCGSQGRFTGLKVVRNIVTIGYISRLAVDMDIHGYIIYPWILRWHNTIALNLCKIPARYKLLTNCTFFNDNLF